VSKVSYASREEGTRKAVLILQSSIREKGAAGKQLSVRLNRKLSSTLIKNRTTTQSAATSDRDRRDELHRQALRAIPTT
jgi:hypothetical protein